MLREINVLSADLIPFIALRLWGNNIAIPLDSYLASPLAPFEGEPIL